MKIIVIYIFLTILASLYSIGTTYAATDSGGAGGMKHTSEHPPHDHHHTDHIKKLDEAMRRKPEGTEEESH